MKKVMFLLAVGIICLTACAQKRGGERGPRMGGGMSINKDSDSTFVALKNETLKKFKQLTFEDAKTGKTMAYNLLVPVLLQHHAPRPLCCLIVRQQSVGHLEDAGLRQEEVFLHRGWWRPESIGRDARFGKGIEGEQRKG